MPGGSEPAADLRASIGKAGELRERGDAAGARVLLESALRAAKPGDPDADAARVELALVLTEVSEIDAAQRALEACSPATRTNSARALLARGGCLRSQGRTRDAHDTYRAASDAARAAGDAATAVTATVMLATIDVQEGDLSGALERLHGALAEATSGGLRRARRFALLALANALVRAGARAEAAAFAEDALGEARDAGDARHEGIALRCLSVLRTLAGENDAAVATAREAVAAAARSGDPLLVAQTRHRAAEALMATGEIALAVAEFEHCVAFGRERGENIVLCIALGGLGEALLASGDGAAAEQHANDARSVARRIGDRHLEIQAHLLLARIAEARGDFAAALAAERARAKLVDAVRTEQSENRLDRMRSQLQAERAQTEDARNSERALRDALAEVKRLRDRLSLENQYLREEIVATGGFDEIVGRSQALKSVLHQLAQVAPTDASVLIYGETGVGKELVARAIHAKSARRERALVVVNCATLPATLVESELFGHEKGAFTGAMQRKIGRFELADGGTIFLDEIGELPLELQAKLLRVLQEGEFERLGDTTTRKADVRVVAATNRDLLGASRQGKFRADLYYRLAVFTVDVPPLRERREDIPLLVAYFTGRYCDRLGKRIERIPEGTMAALTAYDWPGNVRELASVVQRAVILSPGDALVLDGSFATPAAAPGAPAAASAQVAAPTAPAAARVPSPAESPAPTSHHAAPPSAASAVSAASAAPASGAQTASAPAPAASPADETLDGAERAHILRVLGACGWKVKGPGNAADRLGVPPSTLRSRMQKLGITREPSA